MLVRQKVTQQHVKCVFNGSFLLLQILVAMRPIPKWNWTNLKRSPHRVLPLTCFSSPMIDGGERLWVQSETWGLDIHTASQKGLWMRPRQQLCGELGSDLSGTVRSMGVQRSEELHQRKRHRGDEGGKERSVKLKTKRREGRSGEWLDVFFPAKEFSVLLCPQWMHVLQQYIIIRTMTLKSAWGVKWMDVND